MTELLQPGRYPAKATGQSSVYENAKGNLCLAMELDVQGHYLKYITTLATEANGVNTRTIGELKNCFGWDGLDFFWFVDSPEAYSDREVEATIEHTQGTNKTFVNVTYIDPPGGGGAGLPQPGNKAALLAKYGSKFRAIAGGTAAKPTAVPKPPAAPPQAPPSRPPVKPAVAAKVSDQTEVWAVFAKANASMSEGELTAAWFAKLDELFPGVNQGDLTPAQWSEMLAAVDAIPF